MGNVDTTNNPPQTTLPTISTQTISIKEEKKRQETLSRLINEYFHKISQIIISSRNVSNIQTKNDLSSSWSNISTQSPWFRTEIINSLKLREYIQNECIGSWDALHSSSDIDHNHFILYIDISLSSNQNKVKQHSLLERWTIKFNNKMNTINTSNNDNNNNTNKIKLDPKLTYKKMTIQTRSVLSYLRLLPTHQIIRSLAIIDHSTDNDNGRFLVDYLIYSHHNKQDYNNDITSFKPGPLENYSFQPLETIFGTIHTCVCYGSNTSKDFEFLIRSIPGNNIPSPLTPQIDEYYVDNKELWSSDKYNTQGGTDIINPHKEVERIKLNVSKPLILSIADITGANDNKLDINDNNKDKDGNKSSMNPSDDLNYNDIQQGIFDDINANNNNDNNKKENDISQISNFITFCNNANKLKLKSFQSVDKMILKSTAHNNNNNNNNIIKNKKHYNNKCFKLISRELKMRQQRLSELQKRSSTVLCF